ncbi:MAG: ABC transporter permease [Acidimicrobiales bacterium]
MRRFILRRLCWYVPLLFLSSFVVFVLVAGSGDPLANLRSQPEVPAEIVERRARELGLDRPLLTRYGRWLGAAVQGDFGRRAVEETSVRTVLWQRLQVTLRMVAAALAVGVVLSVVVGALGAMRPYSTLDQVVGGVGLVFLSLPAFWLAALLKELVIWLQQVSGRRILPTLNQSDPGMTGDLLHRWADYLSHLVLPTLTLSLLLVASWSRYVRASLIEESSRDYVRAARARGAGPARVLYRHVLPNALVPFSSVVAVDFAAVFGGAVIVERAFNWQGMGQLLIEGVRDVDVNVVLAWLMVTATLVVTLNLLADLVAARLDPRVRLE